jgi:hypothetical protein
MTPAALLALRERQFVRAAHAFVVAYRDECGEALLAALDAAREQLAPLPCGHIGSQRLENDVCAVCELHADVDRMKADNAALREAVTWLCAVADVHVDPVNGRTSDRVAELRQRFGLAGGEAGRDG